MSKMENLSNASENVKLNEIQKDNIQATVKNAKLQQKKDAKKSATNLPKKNILTKESKQGEKLLANLNLSSYAKQLQSFSGAEKSKKDTIYIYPETMSELQKSSDEGKKFRNGLRNSIIRFANNVLVFAKYNRLNDLQTELNKFAEFYKKNYRINDFSLNSISSTKNEAKADHLKLFIAIAKDVLSKGEKKAAKTPKAKK